MPADLEHRLDRLGAQLPDVPAPGPFISAVARRRRTRVLTRVGTAAAGALALGLALYAMAPRPLAPGDGPLLAGAEFFEFEGPPSVALLRVVNRGLSPQDLRLPEAYGPPASPPDALGRFSLDEAGG